VRRRDAYSHYLESWEICDYERPSLLSNLHVTGLCANLELDSLAINVLGLFEVPLGDINGILDM
jgi:hypothetical protein